MNSKNPYWFDNVELRPHPWPGLNWVTTMIGVPDVKIAKDLYIKIFGFVSIFDATDRNIPDVTVFTRLRYRGANIVLVKEGFDGMEKKEQEVSSSGSYSSRFYMYVDDVEDVYAKALESEFKGLQEPIMTIWSDLRARVLCPFGYVWDIAGKI